MTRYIIQITIIVLIILFIAYLLYYREGIENNNSIDVFDILSMSYIKRASTHSTIPDCNSSQIIMVAQPTDVMRCGTLIGDITDSSNCKINTYDQFNYTVTCPTTLLKTTKSPVGTPLSDTKLTPTETYDRMTQYITQIIKSLPMSDSEQSTNKVFKNSPDINNMKSNGISDGISDGIQVFKRPNIKFGVPNPKLVSSLTIVSDPEAVSSSRVKNATPTPSRFQYDNPITTNIDNIQKPVDIPPNTTNTYGMNFDSDVSADTSNNGSIEIPTDNHVYKNIPFPFLPSFKAS
jgi:hypothetical protein